MQRTPHKQFARQFIQLQQYTVPASAYSYEQLAIILKEDISILLLDQMPNITDTQIIIILNDNLENIVSNGFYQFYQSIMILPNSQSAYVKRPYHSQNKPAPLINMFNQQQPLHHTPIKKAEPALPSIYHFVGPHSVRHQLLQQQHIEKDLKQSTLQQQEDKQQFGQMGNSIQSTNRNQSLSKFSTSQLKELTKQYRNMQYFKQCQERWDKQVSRIKRQTQNSKQPSLLERSKKKLVVISNPEKDEILKNYVTTYWEMSLRNHSKILKRHLKGDIRYQQAQLEELLQRDQGIKKVQGSVPRLPIEQLNKLADRELVLTGRNKLASQSMSCDPSVVSDWSSRRSRAMSELPPISHPEMFRISYDSSHKYQMDVIS